MLVWTQTHTTHGTIGRLRVGSAVGSPLIQEFGVREEALLLWGVTIAGRSKRYSVS